MNKKPSSGYKIKQLKKIYPWLNIYAGNGAYIDPDYYQKILKDYIFDNKDDLSILKKYLDNFSNKISSKKINILELGIGNGRSTEIILSSIKNEINNLDLVDSDTKVLQYVEKRFKNKKINYCHSDSIKYLRTTKKQYKAVLAIWSLSHSIHANLHHFKNIKTGFKKIENVLSKFLSKNLLVDGDFYMIHFDSLSDEQKILIKQWKRKFKTYKNDHLQSPSKRIIDNVLNKMSQNGIISFSCRHYIGKTIEYQSMDEALEIFCNFHLETQFNNSNFLPYVINDFKNYFKKFQKKNGKIYIKPGCFIYKIERIK